MNFRLLLPLLLLALPGWSQHYLVGGIHGGFNVPHRKEIRNLVTGHSKAVELGMEWAPNRSREWHYRYTDPYLGVDLFAVELGNREQLGSQFSLIPYVRLPLHQAKNMHELKMGVGIGYATRTWDLDENVKGLVMGSHLNAALLLQYGFRFSVSPKWQLITGLRMNHFSNGAFTLPNLGTNNASVYVAARMRTQKEIAPPLPDVVLHDDFRKWNTSLILASGVRENAPPLGPKYFVFALRAMIERRVTFKSGLLASVDGYLNNSLKPLLERDGQWNDNPADALQLGIAAGYVLHFDPMEFHIMMGGYVRSAYTGQGVLYHRFGLRYFFNDHWSANVMLKTHFAKADHAEFGFGYRF